jgi:hypothetical protein
MKAPPMGEMCIWPYAAIHRFVFSVAAEPLDQATPQSRHR